jgi:hypothetical protein
MARKKKTDVPESTATKAKGPGRPKKEEIKEAAVEQEAPNTQDAMQKRITDCNQEIMAVLQKYNCDLEANILLKPGMVIPQIRIVPVEILQQQRQQQMPPQQPVVQ